MMNIVIKYGGHALDDPSLNQLFCKDMANLVNREMRFVIIHGGGPHINSMLQKLKIESEFVDGLRVTDDKVLEVVEMVLCGQVNKYITRLLEKNGVKACGISGEDGKIFTAIQKNERLGRVGVISSVNPELLFCLLNQGYTPVIAPLALDNDGNPLNINADTAAGAIASSLEGDFILVSDVPGVLDRNDSLIPALSETETGKLVADGTISGGMLPKVEACLNALKKGCKSSIILDGRQPGSLKRYLLDNEPLGTRFIA